MIRFINRGIGQKGIKIGFKRLGGFIQHTRDGAGNHVIHAVLWIQRGGSLHYRYPSVTLVGWKPVLEIQ